MKISFDFDGTLEMSKVQDFAKELIDRGQTVCILTTRYSDPTKYHWAAAAPKHANTLHDELYSIAKKLGITEINFTEYQWKTTVIDRLNINIHLDDNEYEEVKCINLHNKAKAFHYNPYTFEETKKEILYLISQNPN